MRFTVITVCYNAEKSIELTIQSVLKQDYQNIEYLIIDGKSKDKTLDIIKRYACEDGRIKYISEPDDGIYNAMNKGIQQASGDYLLFLNAGDTLFSNKVLSEINCSVCGKKYDLIYGNVMVISDGKETLVKEKMGIGLLLRAAMICHQAVFIKCSKMKQRGYQESYRLSADREWIYWAYKKRFKFKYVNVNVSNYDGTGISSQEDQKALLNAEREEILKKYFPFIFFIRRLLVVWKRQRK